MSEVNGARGRAITPWLDGIPAHWDTRRLKYLVRFVGGGTPTTTEPAYWGGDIPWVSPKDMKVSWLDSSQDRITQAGLEASTSQLVDPGAVLVVVRSGILKHTIPVAINTVPVALNQDLKALIPEEELHARYLARVIEGCQDALLLEWRKLGATVESLETSYMADTLLPIPPPEEQRAITDWLDQRTPAVDEAVRLKEAQLALLARQRQATITHAVTRGLDPAAPTKDSGVEAVGTTPAHWRVQRLMHLTPDERSIMYGIVQPGPHVEGGVPIVKAGNVTGNRLRPADLRRTEPEIEAKYERSRLLGGDLVYAIRGSIGSAELVPDEVAGANITQDVARVSPKPDVHGPWLLYAVKSDAVLAQAEASTLGATVKGINIFDLKRFYVAVPPPEEQVAIAEHLRNSTHQLDETTADVREQVTRLRAYRQALISAAVTGRLDIPSRP